MTHSLNKPSPLISVVIPAFKAEKYIGDSLNSVLCQSYPHWEIWVTDDGSSDKTASLVESIARSHPGKAIVCRRHQTNRGVSASRNTAIREAKGEIIAFLDSDDLWAPDHLSTGLEALREGGADLVYSTVQMFKEKQENITDHWGPTPEDLKTFPRSLYFRNFITPSAVLIKKHVLDRLGGFDENRDIQSCEDHEYWLRMAVAGFKFHYLPTRTCFYRIHEEQATNRAETNILRDVTVLRRRLPLDKEFSSTIRSAIASLYSHLGNYYQDKSRKKALYYHYRAWVTRPWSVVQFKRMVRILARPNRTI